jgi:hypothetical protein
MTRPIKKIIHVNQHIIRANIDKPAAEREPPLTIKTYKTNTRAHRVIIHGASEVVYSPDKPLSCGARLWIETHADLTIHELPEA